MILIVIAALCLISVPLSGGHLRRLSELRLRGVWTAPLALALQVLITTVAPGGNRLLHIAIHIATYVMIGLFLLANRRIPGVTTVGAGALINALAIMVNGGVMPAAATAQRLAGLTEGGGFHNSALLAHPHLLWLGDIIPVPGPLPNVMSIGDCIVFAGMLIVLHRACGKASPLRPPATTRTLLRSGVERTEKPNVPPTSVSNRPSTSNSCAASIPGSIDTGGESAPREARFAGAPRACRFATWTPLLPGSGTLAQSGLDQLAVRQPDGRERADLIIGAGYASRGFSRLRH